MVGIMLRNHSYAQHQLEALNVNNNIGRDED
jgi:hypothetical protein